MPHPDLRCAKIAQQAKHRIHVAFAAAQRSWIGVSYPLGNGRTGAMLISLWPDCVAA